MKAFFHGWRRKVGCVALIAACAVTGMWLRSLHIFDTVSFTTEQSQHQVTSADGSVYWKAVNRNDAQQHGKGWTQVEPSKYPNPEKVKFIQLYFLRNANAVVPYWSLILPLTLLSAYLLLVPSRKRPPATSQSHA